MFPEIVCLRCYEPMVEADAPWTAWIASEQRERPCRVLNCRGCDVRVVMVSRCSERYAEQCEVGVLQLP